MPDPVKHVYGRDELIRIHRTNLVMLGSRRDTLREKAAENRELIRRAVAEAEDYLPITTIAELLGVNRSTIYEFYRED